MLFKKTKHQPINCLNCHTRRPTVLNKNDNVCSYVCIFIEVYDHDKKKIYHYTSQDKKEELELIIVDKIKEVHPNSNIIIFVATHIHGGINYEYNEEDEKFYAVDTTYSSRSIVDFYEDSDKDWYSFKVLDLVNSVESVGRMYKELAVFNDLKEEVYKLQENYSLELKERDEYIEDISVKVEYPSSVNIKNREEFLEGLYKLNDFKDKFDELA